MNVPDQLTGLIPPGRPAPDTWEGIPERKVLPDTPDFGAVTIHWPLANTALTHVAFGSKMTVESGTETLNLLEVIFWLVNLIVTGPEVAFRPVGFRAALNQM